MKYNQPLDQPLAPTAGYIDGNPATGVAGSIVPAAALEFTQREIVAVIAASGQTPDNGDLAQLQKAIRGDVLSYYEDGGAQNAIAIAPLPAYIGMPNRGWRWRVKLANDITGDTTFQLSGNAPVPMRRSGGAAMTGGVAFKGDIVSLTWDGTYVQFTGGGSGGGNLLVTTNILLDVPSQYPTIRAAVLASGMLFIAPNVIVTIRVAAGYVENLTANTGPIYLSHPFGQRIRIIGAPLNGAFPLKAELANKTPAQIQALLLTRFQVVVNAVGTDAWQLKSGAINTIGNILTISDGMNNGGRYGAKLSSWSDEVGTGSAALVNMWFHNCGLDGVRSEQLGTVQANNVGVTCCGRAGGWFSHGTICEVNFGNWTAMYNQHGVVVGSDGGFMIDSQSGAINLDFNSGNGVFGSVMGKFNGLAATGLTLTDNGGWGAYLYSQSQATFNAATQFARNGMGDVYCNVLSEASVYAASVGTCSPPLNSTGNKGSVITN